MHRLKVCARARVVCDEYQISIRGKKMHQIEVSSAQPRREERDREKDVVLGTVLFFCYSSQQEKQTPARLSTPLSRRSAADIVPLRRGHCLLRDERDEIAARGDERRTTGGESSCGRALALVVVVVSR